MRKAFLTTIIAVGVPVQASASAQSPDTTTYRLTGTRIALGQDIRIERDEEVTDAAIVVGGSLNVDGRVRDGVVVVGGNLHLSATADIRGDVVLVGGTLTRDPGARLTGGVNYVSFGDWSRRNFAWLPSVRFGEFGSWIGLAGTLARVSALGVLMAMMLIVARAPVARVGRAALAEPLRAFVIGLAAEIFFVPLLVAAAIGLAMTIIGIPFVALLVPIAIVIALFAFVLGFTALSCRIGESIEARLGGGRATRLSPRPSVSWCCWRPACWRASSTWHRSAWRRSRLGDYDRSRRRIHRLDDGGGRGHHHRPWPLVYGAAADCGAAG